MPVNIHTDGPIRLDIVSTSDTSVYNHPKIMSLNCKIGWGVEGNQHSYDFDVSRNILQLGCVGVALIPLACLGMGWIAANLQR